MTPFLCPVSPQGYTTMLLTCSIEMHSIGYAWRGLKEQLGEEIDNEIQRMAFLKGKKVDMEIHDPNKTNV